MRQLLNNIDTYYAVVGMVAVGIALRCSAMIQGVNTMRKHNKSEVQAVNDNLPIVTGSVGIVDTTANTVAAVVNAAPSAVVTTVAAVAKVVMAIAGIKPPEFINLVTNDGIVAYKVPLHVKGACSKRALATALHNAIMRKGYTSVQAESLGSRLFVICGGLWVADNSDATGHVAIGECKGNKGATGYVKVSKAWWTAQANVSKADSLLPQVAVLVDYLCIDNNGIADYAQAVARTETACAKYRDTYKAFTDKAVDAPSM